MTPPRTVPVIIEQAKKGASTRKTLVLVAAVAILALILAFFLTEIVIRRRHRHQYVNKWYILFLIFLQK